ncbi:MAG TPA: hypothetical protein PLY80_17205 [Pseudomonadota bacterium]|nr:hypothetical protein [Pseudomonadota bacterium]
MVNPAEATKFRIYAQRQSDGDVQDLYLLATDAGLAIWEAMQPPAPIPAAALLGVFARYGKPLEEGIDVTPLWAREDAADAPLELALPSGVSVTLQRFRFMPFGWVHPEDYLLWSVQGVEPLAAPAALVAHALSALARAYKPTA